MSDNEALLGILEALNKLDHLEEIVAACWNIYFFIGIVAGLILAAIFISGVKGLE